MADTYTSPPLDAKGLASRTGLSWNGHSWGNNSGQTWNTHVPYAIGLAPTALRVELHDTTNDHGLTDPSTKRRAEIGSADHFKNGTEYWVAFSCQPEVDNLKPGLVVRLSQPFHWPSGASPAEGITLASTTKGLEVRVTIKTDSTGNVTKGTAPVANGDVLDFVLNTKLGANGFAKVWMSRNGAPGVLICNYVGQVGSTKEDGYSFRLGNYGTLNGMTIVTEYANVSPLLSSVSLLSRVAAPPAW